MKKCGYCSRRHNDDATACVCGSVLPFGPENIMAMAYAALASGGWTALNDISTYQESSAIPGDIDFDKMATKSRGVFIKLTQALRIDADGARNYERSKGKLRRGAYIYMDWTRPLYEQVDFFFSQFLTREDLGELPPVLDYEEWDGAPDPGNARLQLRAAIERAEYHLKRLGWDLVNLPILLYTSPGYWAKFGSADSWWALHCDLWIAHYFVSRPFIPLPWLAWTFWQYSDKGDGLAHGVESKQIDMDWYSGDLAKFERYALPLSGTIITLPPPTGEIMQRYQIAAPKGLNLRVDHAESAAAIKLLASGTFVHGTGQTYIANPGEMWAEVKTTDGKQGWIACLFYGGQVLARTA